MSADAGMAGERRDWLGGTRLPGELGVRVIRKYKPQKCVDITNFVCFSFRVFKTWVTRYLSVKMQELLHKLITSPKWDGNIVLLLENCTEFIQKGHSVRLQTKWLRWMHKLNTQHFFPLLPPLKNRSSLKNNEKTRWVRFYYQSIWFKQRSKSGWEFPGNAREDRAYCWLGICLALPASETTLLPRVPKLTLILSQGNVLK